MTIRAFALTLALIAIANPASAQAPDEARVTLALKMLELSDAKGLMERSMKGMMDAQLESMTSMVRQAGAPESVLEQLKALQNDVQQLVFAELKWETLSRDVALVYSSVFTESELREMVTFYESPTGRKLTEKSPEMMSRMMEITMQRIKVLEPKLMELIKKRMKQEQ